MIETVVNPIDPRFEQHPMGYMTMPYVSMEFVDVDLGLDDELFDFDDTLRRSINEPTDEDVLLELQQSFENIKASGDYDRLIYATSQLMVAACTHNHLAEVADQALEEAFGGNEKQDKLELDKQKETCSKHKQKNCGKCKKS